MPNKDELLTRTQRKLGQVMKITLPNGHWCPALVTHDLNVAFYDRQIAPLEPFHITEITTTTPVIFTCAVYFQGISRQRWPVFGKRPELVAASPPLRHFLRDIGHPGRFRKDMNIWAEPAEIDGAELMAVWTPELVEQRAFTYFFRKPLYEFEYGEYTFRDGRVNDGREVFDATDMAGFARDKFYPMISPPPGYRRLTDDAERLRFAREHFDPQRGWSVP